MEPYKEILPLVQMINDFQRDSSRVNFLKLDRKNLILCEVLPSGDVESIIFYYYSLNNKFIEILTKNSLIFLKYYIEFLDANFDLSIFRKYNLNLKYPIASQFEEVKVLI